MRGRRARTTIAPMLSEFSPVRRRRAIRGIVVATALAMPTGLPAAATEAVLQWQQDLADQMMDDYVCEIGYLSRVMNREVEGAPLIQARVHCLDGRAYDARRHKDAWFAIEPCQTVKRSC